MTEPLAPLHALADAAGVARSWRDVEGSEQVVADEAVCAVLEALGHAAASEAQIGRSLRALEHEALALAPLVVADAGQPIRLPRACRKAEATDSNGTTVALAIADGVPLAPHAPGYYDLVIDRKATRLAVAPPACPAIPGAGERPWGVAVQIPALRGSRASAFGGFGELAEAVARFAAAGADAVAINPVHALFPGNGHGFSPYSPSSRRFLNGALADPALLGLPPLPEAGGGALIDWEGAMPARLGALRDCFVAIGPERRAAIAAECASDEGLRRHAIFDALDCVYRPQGAGGWQDWPAALHDPGGKAAAEFAGANAAEVEFHLFVQWLAARGLATVQTGARALGMATGIVGDLAIGVNPGGSDGWTQGHAMLRGLTIGAPPDPLGPLGQNWNLSSYSPAGLRATGYEPWLAMIRSALANAGALRIDHAFGLARLWVIPQGGGPGDGAYLEYPFADLVRLLTLEAHLAGAAIIAEDLGTAPFGFSEAIAARAMLGMRVLWFQRAADHGFIGAQDYDPLAVALTGTHDTPTLAGWWRGTDLDWAALLGRLPEGMSRAEAESIRDWDRGLLWSTIAGDSPRPAPAQPHDAVRAGIEHIGRTPCQMRLYPLEDLLGIAEQPNLPGTITEHPNWRRRLSDAEQAAIDEPGFAPSFATPR